VVDPPPPLEAAGSSLLYSEEFYQLAKTRLAPHGILQAWVPGGDPLSGAAAIRSVQLSFPYVRVFDSIEQWGNHLLAPMEPIDERSVDDLIARMPKAAQRDLLEWSKNAELKEYLGRVVMRQDAIEWHLNPNTAIRITDDRPFNEYFVLRQQA